MEEKEKELLLTPSKRTPAVDANGCDHKDPSTLVAYTNELGYFKKTYLEKNKFWPKKCDNCSKKFVDKPASQMEDGEYKVSARYPCYLCKHAANSKHPCIFGLCKGCKVDTMGRSPTKRRIRKRLESEFAAV